MKSRRGVYYDLSETEYIKNVFYFSFCFSSKFLMKKFEDDYYSITKQLEYKFVKKYEIPFDLKMYMAFVLYKDIERRGYRVINNRTGDVYTCPESIKFVGEIKTK